MKKIEITTERLLLKPLGSVYLETVNAYATDYENTKISRNTSARSAFILTSGTENSAGS